MKINAAYRENKCCISGSNLKNNEILHSCDTGICKVNIYTKVTSDNFTRKLGKINLLNFVLHVEIVNFAHKHKGV
jgi:fructose/tagatose bisphosphate aldolase